MLSDSESDSGSGGKGGGGGRFDPLVGMFLLYVVGLPLLLIAVCFKLLGRAVQQWCIENAYFATTIMSVLIGVIIVATVRGRRGRIIASVACILCILGFMIVNPARRPDVADKSSKDGVLKLNGLN
jgi:hypothetical protein